jgi:hypothetical protein
MKCVDNIVLQLDSDKEVSTGQYEALLGVINLTIQVKKLS